jgi:cystathionine beta-synthase
MADFGFLVGPGPTAGDVLHSKDASIPDLVLVTPEEPARRAIALMRELGVSQVVVSITKDLPLAAKEVSGAINELQLMDQAFHDPSVLDRPIGEVMGPAMPMVGIGEPVSRVVKCLDSASAVLMLEGGHPIGVLSRADVLSFLASRSPG